MNNLCLSILLQNRAELRLSYGQALLQQVEAATRRHIEETCSEWGMKLDFSGDEYRIMPPSQTWLRENGDSADYLQYQDLEEVIARLCSQLACAADYSSLASLRAKIVDRNGARAVLWADGGVVLPCALVDMRNIERLLDAIWRDAIVFAFQPVCDSSNGADVCYRECLARVGTEEGHNVLMPGDFIPDLERLGLVRVLDRYVVKRVIGILKSKPAVSLSVNISAQSAVIDLWWASTMLELMSRPDVAQRLVIEVTETSRITKGSGRSFARHMQTLGCRIAVDDFGAGHSIETALEFECSDLIKLDKRFIASAALNGHVGKLKGIFNVARGLGRDVVIEGVENRFALQCARSMGARWVQGHYVGMPDQMY